MSTLPIHVVIIGGGIGGLCLAQCLKASGMSVAVYERNPADTWLEGFRISINPIGSRALYECLPPVLWEAFVAAAGKPPAGLGFLNERLEELLVIGEAFMSNKADTSIDAHYPINRITLRHLLLAGMDDVIHYDKTFERYEQTADGKVTAFFADGTSATGDVLVAADGANSRVRAQYLPQARRVETGATAIGGKLPLTDQSRAWLPRPLATRMNLIMPSGRYTLFNAVFDHTRPSIETMKGIRERAGAANLDPELLFDNSPDYILWAFIAHTDEYPSDALNFDASALQRFIEHKMRGWHPAVHRLIAESDLSSIALQPFKSMVPIGPWESSNITLLGDAIHNMPPVGGLGGNMALRDASALARKLIAVHRGEVALLPAIREYEAEMREHGFGAVRAALGYTQQAISRNRVSREAAKAWFRLCHVVPPLKRVFEDKWTEHMRNQPEHVTLRKDEYVSV